MSADHPSTKPYLLRALWEWCCDNGLTPYLAVQVDGRTQVPREFVRDGQIVLNIGADATNKLVMGNDFIEFQARFGGAARQLSIPVGRVTAIYARETGAGMAFELDETNADALTEAGDAPTVADFSPPDEPPPERPKPESGRPWLQRIK
ncbi:MAG: ClpXP protease specificity-enhancing factor [Dechloromonas sp.]|nr:ClpXP protease specificity-enhancing factor [Dechloromonas sp.]